MKQSKKQAKKEVNPDHRNYSSKVLEQAINPKQPSTKSDETLPPGFI